MVNNDYITWSDDKSRAKAFSAMAESIGELGAVRRSVANTRIFTDVDSNVSVRSEFTPADYSYYRSFDSSPKTDKEIIEQCMWAYDSVGIVHNVVDLMGDFTVQGIRIVHKDPRIENFCVDWWRYIDGDKISERLSNLLYRCANVFVHKRFGKVPQNVEKEWKKAFGFNSETVESVKPPQRGRIPTGYSFLNPLSIEPIAGEIGNFLNKQVYGLRLDNVFNKVSSIGLTQKDNQIVKQLISQMPDDIKSVLKSKNKVMILDSEFLEVLHYRKDDWQLWAHPLLLAILTDIKMLNKMKLADLSALDGVISNVRLWNLGDFEHKLYPTKNLIEKLRNLLHNTGPGTADIIWGPELKFTESQTAAHQWLGMTKYIPTLNAIYEGLGVPPSLTGSSGEQGFTNNLVSMKTLLKRLQYGRNLITQFWTKELKLLQKGMGWRFAPEIMFDHMILSDESSEKALLVQLWDRDIISTESLLNKLDGLPSIEKIRLIRENRNRVSGKIPPKASPYHNPQQSDDLKKIILQKGVVTPSELGIELLPKKEGEKTFVEQTQDLQRELKKYQPVGRVDGGRPSGSKDKTKRKTKTVKPLSGKADDSFFSRFLWANQSFKQICDVVTQPVLDFYNKKNLRSLTTTEKEEYERMCMAVFSNISPYSEITNELVYDILSKNLSIDNEIISNASILVHQFFTNTGREPNLEEMHQIQCSAYCLKYEEN